MVNLSFSILIYRFNRFFYESGAALSFIIDYRAIGQNIARMIQSLADGGGCSSTGPPFSVLLNRKAIEKLELSMPRQLPEGVIIE